MTNTQRERLAALRRLAAHADTPEHERENAKARIKEMEEKYDWAREPEPEKTPFGIPYPNRHDDPFASVSVEDMFRDFAEKMGVDFANFYTSTSRSRAWERTRRQPGPGGYSPFHEYGSGDIPKRPFVNTENPFEEEGHFTGRRLSDFVRYVVKKYEKRRASRGGPYGKVRRVSGGMDTSHSNAIFKWPCTKCDEPVRYTVSWQQAGYARKEPAAMDQLLKSLYAIWDGHSDNTCPMCSRFTEVNDPSWIGQFSRWCEGRDEGEHGRVPHFETSRDMMKRTLVFSWECPRCSATVEVSIGDELLESGEEMQHAVDFVFQHLNGDKWNWCDRCQKVKDKFDKDCEEARAKGPEHFNCRCTTSEFTTSSGQKVKYKIPCAEHLPVELGGEPTDGAAKERSPRTEPSAPDFKTGSGEKVKFGNFTNFTNCPDLTIEIDGVVIGKVQGVYVPDDEEDDQ